MSQNKEIIIVQVHGAGKSQKQLKGVSGALNTMAKTAGLAAAAYFGPRMLLAGFKELSTQGSKLQNVSKAFDNMGKKVGFTTGALAKFRKATNDTVSDVELMTKANNAMALGIVENEDQFANLMDTAQRLGAALGQDTASALDSLVTGMGRQSKLMLDNLGIMVDTQGAYEDYADVLGVSVNQLTESEKKTAFNNAAMSEATRIVNEMGSEQETAQMKMSELSSTMTNMASSMGDALMPALTNITDKFVMTAKAAKEFFQESTETPLETSIREMKELGINTTNYELALNRINQNNVMDKLGGQTIDIESSQLKVNELNEDNAKLLEKQSQITLGLSISGKDSIANMSKEKQAITDILTSKRDLSASELEGLLELLYLKSQENNFSMENLKAHSMLGVQMSRNQGLALGDLEMAYESFQVQQDANNDQIEKEEELIGFQEQKNVLTEQQIALQKSLNKEKENEGLVEEVNAKNEQKNSKVKGQIAIAVEKAGLNVKKQVERSVSEIGNKEKAEDYSEALRTAWNIAGDSYRWGTKIGGPFLGAAMGALGLASGLKFAEMIQKFGTGGDFITDGPQMIMVGDNPSGKEHVQISPLGGDPNIDGPQGGNITLNISGNIMSEQYTEEVIIPQIKEGLRLGGDIGVN